MSVLSSLAKNPLAQRSYTTVLESGFIPRRAFAHYFMNTAGLRSRVHLQNYYSLFFPDELTPVTARVWLCNPEGKVVARKNFEIAPFGQLYLEIEDIAGYDLEVEGMVMVDILPPKSVRGKLKTIPNILQLNIQTPYWVSYRDADDNYMYVHSIESYRGKVFGAVWPLRTMLSKATPVRRQWESWRLLDVNLLDELQIVVMNHAYAPGDTVVSVISEKGDVLWTQDVHLTTRQSRRVIVPQDKIAQWKADGIYDTVRVALDPVLSDNGKPYVLMRYAGGPLSMHHG